MDEIRVASSVVDIFTIDFIDNFTIAMFERPRMENHSNLSNAIREDIGNFDPSFSFRRQGNIGDTSFEGHLRDRVSVSEVDALV